MNAPVAVFSRIGRPAGEVPSSPQPSPTPVVPDAPLSPAVPDPGPTAPDTPPGPTAPEPSDPLPAGPTGPDVPAPDPSGPETG